MTTPIEPTSEQTTDSGILANFVHELNITRKRLLTYPPGHPMIADALAKVLDFLDPLFEQRDDISLGVAKESLLFEQQWLDNNNRSIRDFSGTLAELDIAAIHFRGKPDQNELLKLAALMNADRQKINLQGGLNSYLQQLQLTQIEITPINYAAFQTTEADSEEQPASLWEAFLSRLLDDSLSLRQETTRLADLDPKAIADIINQNYVLAEGDAAQTHDRAIADFVRQLQRTGREKKAPGQQFYQLLEQLDPALRRQFLNSTFRHLASQPTSAEQTLQAFPEPLIELAMQELNQNQLTVSSAMLNLIGKLSQHHHPGQGQVTSGKSAGSDNVGEQLKTLFREEDSGKFTPDSYQATLDQIILQEHQFQLADKETEQLRKQLLSSSSERHNCAIIFNLLGKPQLQPEQHQGMQDNLISLAQFFLETGDFKGLGYLRQRLGQYLLQHPVIAAERTSQLQEKLNSADFLQEVLDNLSRWDEQKQQEIVTYIRLAGASIAASLIERLAAEEDKSLRRVYLTTLAGLGEAAHPAIYARFDDQRWFLIRNLLAALRMQDGPLDLQKVEQLERHPHLRVNQELLQLLFKFDRNRANRLLTKQLDSLDPQLRQYAVQLAEQSRDPAIVQKLLSLLTIDKLNDDSLPLKIQILKCLGGIGSGDALPTLRQLLKPGLFFTSKRKLELQTEIVRQLDKFPLEKSRPLLQKLTRSRNKQLSGLATEKLRQLLRKHV